MAKVSRKQLLKSSDEFLTFTEKAGRWIANNQRRLLLGGVVVIVIAAVIFGLVSYKRKHEASGALAFGNSFYEYKVLQASPTPGALAALVQSLTSVADEYSSTEAGKQARFYLASLLIETGDNVKAQEQLQILLDEPDLRPELAAMAWGALGQSYEAAGQTEEARRAYGQAIGASRPESANMWRSALARLLLDTDQQQSIALYRQVMDNSNSQFLRISAARMLINLGQDITRVN